MKNTSSAARIWALVLVITVASARGCAKSPNAAPAIGSGQYLQFSNGSAVIAETDTTSAGLMNCPNQANLAVQQNPVLAGKVKCAAGPATETLAFSFKAHNQSTESDGLKRSSPFVTRASTSALCKKMRDATKAQQSTVILEDRCAG